MKLFIKDFFSKCDQIQRKLQIWLHLLKKPLKKHLIFCAVARKDWNLLLLFYYIHAYPKGQTQKLPLSINRQSFGSCVSFAAILLLLFLPFNHNSFRCYGVLNIKAIYKKIKKKLAWMYTEILFSWSPYDCCFLVSMKEKNLYR